MFRTIFLSMVLGVAWHCIVLGIMGQLTWFAVCLGLPIALLTGAVAGVFTVWSRRRRRGKESVLAVVATYYLALLVYAIGMTLTESIRYAYHGESGPTYSFTWSKVGDEITLFAAYGTMFAVLLLPLCYLTRLLVWRAHCRIRSGKWREPTSAAAGLAARRQQGR